MRKISAYLLTLSCIILLQVQSASAQAYKIEARIEGLKDTSLILSYRYGPKFCSLDTSYVNSEGYASFQDTVPVERGMYQIILPDKSFIDFFIDDSPQISIKTVKSALIDSLSSPDSRINQVFFEWQANNQNLRKEASEIQKKMEAAQEDSQEYMALQEQISLIRKSNQDLWDNAIEKLRGSLPGKFLAGIRPFEVPENIGKGPDGKIDQAAQYEYYKAHFFDDVEWSDAALVRTPLIYSKLDQFFKRVVPGIPDSVINYVDEVIALSSKNPEMYRFVVQHLFNYYSQPEIMGMDAVYVHIADNYYLSGKADWVEEKNLKEIEHRVNSIRPLLIGSRAPDLPGLETPEGEVISITDIKADFTILYFWEPDCGFCKTATPKLFQIYKDYKDKGIEAIAVNTRIDKEAWEKFIAEHQLTWINVYAPDTVRTVLNNYEAYSTPKVFILNSEKLIVAKDINVDQVSQVLDYLMSSR
jgi:thiol-disulfide isomerase/thioredoxin